MAELTDLERDVLAFEHLRWNHQGAKDQAVHDRFGLSMTRYQQLLLSLCRRPEAQQHDPVVVNRLLRLQTQRRRRRAG